MCGIAGVWTRHTERPEELESILRSMTDSLIHRGPDDWGTFVDGDAGIGLGNRRLAILDPSPLGHQPMTSSCGRFVIVYNGECYNFRELRKDLEETGRAFHTQTDTEVIVEGCAQWGVEGMAGKMNGMFAFALWDKKSRALSLVRDRLGIKPLYYGWAGKTFLLGSELKALCAHPEFRRKVDRQSLYLYLQYGYVPAPHAIFCGVRTVPAGGIIRLGERGEPAAGSYWSAAEVVEAALASSRVESPEEAVEKLDQLLTCAVRARMISDVPLGALLSGGIDSSTVVSIMAEEARGKVRTYTVGFEASEFDEARTARAVADYLATEHTEICVTPADVRSVIPRIPDIYDEPFADSSQIPTYLVSQLARNSVTVALSGDGGDELFCGYTNYAVLRRINAALRLVPPPMRSGLARLLRTSPRHRMARLGEILMTSGDRDLLHDGLSSHWSPELNPTKGLSESPVLMPQGLGIGRGGSLVERAMFRDLVQYLPDDILRKVDRASMAVSLETRVPLLDHRVVEFAWSLPHKLKVRHGHAKWILRQVTLRRLPAGLIDRPKKGFSIPLAEWLRGPLRVWADELLDESRLSDEGFFDPGPITKVWAEHLSGARDWKYRLWTALMFQAWQERWLKN